MTTTPQMPVAHETLQIRRRSRRWLEKATLAGIAVSIGIHLVLLLIAAFLNVQFNFGDAGGQAGEGVEFAILTSEDLAAMTAKAIDVSSVETDISPMETVTDFDLLADVNTDLSVSDLADTIAPSLTPAGGSLSGVDPSVGSAGAGSGNGASFFGLEAAGSRFAYIVDRSGSMNSLTSSGEQTRWEMTRAELIRSITGLDTGAEFTVELYSGSSVSLFGTGDWIKATQPNKLSARVALFMIDPSGATHPNTAMDRVFTLKPPPDAIYLMTDGEFVESDRVSERIKSLNRGKRVPIHCILFGNPGGSPENTKRVIKVMRTIARTSGGRFTHIREGKP
ncbi:MAG: hypothetical protein JKY96_01030 [Phycisphaerales bacterium]|nr:hypothetical protein [Phycisphaerales bacterium]